MSDAADGYRALRARQREQRARTRQASVSLLERLEAAGKVEIERFDDSHWRVSRGLRAVDVWPSTERWRPVGARGPARLGLVTAMGYLAGRHRA